MQNRQRIPFQIALGDEIEKLTTSTSRSVSGLVGLEADHLVLQYQTTTATTSMETMATHREVSPVTELALPFPALAVAELSGRWGRRLGITVNDLRLLDGVPGARGERLTLKFKRRDREAADALGQELQQMLADLGLARLEREIEHLERPAIEGPEGA